MGLKSTFDLTDYKKKLCIGYFLYTIPSPYGSCVRENQSLQFRQLAVDLYFQNEVLCDGREAGMQALL